MNLVYISLQVYINYALPLIKLSKKKWIKEMLFEKTSGQIAIAVSLISFTLIMYAYGLI